MRESLRRRDLEITLRKATEIESRRMEFYEIRQLVCPKTVIVDDIEPMILS